MNASTSVRDAGSTGSEELHAEQIRAESSFWKLHLGQMRIAGLRKEVSD